jgi:carbon starvation protein
LAPVLAAAGAWYSNSLFLAAVAIVWLILGYRWYGKRIERRIVVPTDEPTPAVVLRDNVDYYPAKPVVLFGHHFASIAGAGPVLGPVLAVAAFGWGPTALWILVGVVLIGAVHDYLALMVSVRNKGQSLAEVAGTAVNGTARVLFLIFVWIALVLVITAFCGAAAKAFMSTPAIVLPTFSLMLIAVLFGLMVNKLRVGTAPATVLALALLMGAIYWGIQWEITLDGTFGVRKESVKSVWLIILLGYGVVASVLPVWVLLQPRDYIDTWILIFGMAMGFVGIAWVRPSMTAPTMATSMAKVGPIWPMLFIIVACGAVSGFHSLVAGGTTSKQLSHERQGLLVGYGAMLTEAALAILALIAVGAGLHYSADQGGDKAYTLLSVLGQKAGGGPIIAFSKGFEVLTEPFLGRLGRAIGAAGLGLIIGATLVKAFVMTTLDTSVRLGRFITSELAGRKVGLLRNRFVASAAIAVPAYLLAVQPGAFKKIWPMFGAANQLIAALTLIVISAYLLQRGKSTRYTVIPAIFMLLTTVAALLWQAYTKLLKTEPPNYTLGITAIVMLVLALVLAYQGRHALFGLAVSRPAED